MTACACVRDPEDLARTGFLRAMPGFAVRRNHDGTSTRRRITPEALMQLFNVNSIGALVEALMAMDESARDALLSAMEGS